MKGKIDQKEKRKKRGRKVSESGSARVVDGSRRSETVGDLTGGYEPGACRPEVTSHPRGSECAYRMCGIGSPSEPSTSHSQFLHIAASSHIASHRVYTRTHARIDAVHAPAPPPPLRPPLSKGPRAARHDFSTNFTRPRPTVTDCATRREPGLLRFSLLFSSPSFLPFSAFSRITKSPRWFIVQRSVNKFVSSSNFSDNWSKRYYIGF